jgi:hypothetical protein
MQNKEYYKTYCELNKEKIKKRKKEYYQLKKEVILNKQKEYYLNNTEKIKEKLKENYYNNIEENRKRGVDYYEKNKDTIKEKQRISYNEKNKSEQVKNKRKSDPIFKLKTYIGNRLRDYLKGKKYTKKSKIFDIVGCSPDELKEHIQSKFIEGMCWENHGEWHIDHVVPLASAKTEDEIYKLNHYSNLQPLWKIDNLKKSNKLINN